MNNPLIRDIAPDDIDQILEINAKVEHWTSPMARKRLHELLDYAIYRKVVTTNTGLAGFILAMADNSEYDNDNLHWFRQRCSHFVYVDRIIIRPECAGAGLGQRLYGDLFGFAETNGYQRIVCEYNVSPLNKASMHFHTRMGFAELGRRTLATSGKEVSMQSRPCTESSANW